MNERLVRIPRTATRPQRLYRDREWAKLLERVEPEPRTGFDFYGKLLTPGASVPETELWPTENYPPIPVLLESCQICFEGRGHNRNPIEYILWIYQLRKHEWKQVARCSSHRSEWVYSIGHVARKFAFPRQIPPAPDLWSAARRIAAVVELELLQLTDNAQRLELLQCAHDCLAGRASNLMASGRLYQMPLQPPMFEDLALGAEPDQVGLSVREMTHLPTYALSR